jgi:hypothetical protein
MRALAISVMVLLATVGAAAAKEPVPQWECGCEREPCSCKPPDPTDRRLCDIVCPRGTRFLPDCSCEPSASGEPSAEERRRQVLEAEKARRSQEDERARRQRRP